MKTLLILVLSIAIALFTIPAIGQDAPNFYQNTYPEHALKAALEASKALDKGAELDAKTRALIGLAVSAQIPCTYCVYANNKKALKAGASENEIREAVAVAAQIRHWSTVLNGMGYDLDAFKAEFDKLQSGK